MIPNWTFQLDGTRRAGRLAVLAVCAALVPVATADAASVQWYSKGLTEGSLGAYGGPFAITLGPDGNMWFGGGAGQIGRITPAGRITEFTRGRTPGMLVGDLTTGPDGNIWATGAGTGGSGAIWRVTPQGRITEFKAGIEPFSQPAGIAAGPDGNLWFAQAYETGTGVANRIGRVTTAGEVTNFDAGFDTRRPQSPQWIVAGPDGSLWYTKMGAVGRMPPGGDPTEFSTMAPNGRSEPWGIAAGPDGNVWFADYQGEAIGRITTEGAVSFFSKGISHPPTHITSASDGNLWYTGRYAVGRVTPSGAITEFRVSRSGDLGKIAAAPDGRLWFTDYIDNRIGVLDPTARAVTAPCKRSRQASRRARARLRSALAEQRKSRTAPARARAGVKVDRRRAALRRAAKRSRRACS